MIDRTEITSTDDEDVHHLPVTPSDGPQHILDRSCWCHPSIHRWKSDYTEIRHRPLAYGLDNR